MKTMNGWAGTSTNGLIKSTSSDISVDAGNIEIDCKSANQFIASNRVSISSNVTISFLNHAICNFITFKAAITNLATITFPDNSISGDTRILSKVFTPVFNGSYTISIFLTENDYDVIISQNPAT